MATPYLYQHQNPNAPKRANGKRFWGYPTRSAKIRLLGIHTTESVFDKAGPDGGAEAVAAFQSQTARPSSYHRIVDRDTTVVMLPDEATAFGIVGANSPSVHLSMAMQASLWDDPKARTLLEPLYQRAIREAAQVCKAHGIPVRRLTRQQALDGHAGIVGHGTMDPSRRTDPGAGFPWTRFLSDVANLVAGKAAPAKPVTPPHAPPPAPTPRNDLEDFMAALIIAPDGVTQYVADASSISPVTDQKDLALLRRCGVVSSTQKAKPVSYDDLDALYARTGQTRPK
jgi:hypothetical protein